MDDLDTTLTSKAAVRSSGAFLRIGDRAPNFHARSTTGPIEMAAYTGRWLVFFSHPADFTPVCTSEFVAFAKASGSFAALDCDLLALSVDSLYSHFAWVRAIRDRFDVEVRFPIVEDPTLIVGQAYGMVAPDAHDAGGIDVQLSAVTGGHVRNRHGLLLSVPDRGIDGVAVLEGGGGIVAAVEHVFDFGMVETGVADARVGRDRCDDVLAQRAGLVVGPAVAVELDPRVAQRVEALEVLGARIRDDGEDDRWDRPVLRSDPPIDGRADPRADRGVIDEPGSQVQFEAHCDLTAVKSISRRPIGEMPTMSQVSAPTTIRSFKLTARVRADASTLSVMDC